MPKLCSYMGVTALCWPREGEGRAPVKLGALCPRSGREPGAEHRRRSSRTASPTLVR